MGEKITIKHECESCGGTGLYVGCNEYNGAAVVCSRCNGRGYRESVFKKFTGRKERKGVKRVFEANPGVVLGAANFKLSDFGGLSYKDWLAGKTFGRGTECRKFTCPRWWAQSTGQEKPEWSECKTFGSFDSCPNFGKKDKCWKRWDNEAAGLMRKKGKTR